MGDEATITTEGGAQGGAQLSTTARGTATPELLTPEPAAGAPPAPAAPTGTPAPVTRSAAAAAAITPEGLAVRLKREREAADRKWAEELGYKTPAEAKAAIEESRELKAEKDAAKLAEMSEVERLRTQLTAAQATIADLEGKIDHAETETLRERETRMLEGVAGKLLKPRYVRTAIIEFREHLREMTEEEVAALPSREVEKWFAKFAKENPELTATAAGPAPAVEPEPAPAARPAVVPQRRPITTGAPPPKRALAAPAKLDNAPHMFNGKTSKPGQPNSMNATELAAFAKRNGVTYPGGGNRANGSRR